MQKTRVRAMLADQTRDIHEALHDNPVLSRLTQPDITAPEYLAALNVLSCFYHRVEQERSRLDAWGDFNLAGACNALDGDLINETPLAVTLSFENPSEVLGGLYVAHGASFGRSLFRKNLKEALPDVSQGFVSQSVSKPTWRALTDTLETHGQDEDHLQAMLKGAARSFETVSVVSRAL